MKYGMCLFILILILTPGRLFSQETGSDERDGNQEIAAGETETDESDAAYFIVADIIIEGNTYTKKQAILYSLDFKVGDKINGKMLKIAAMALKDSNIYSEVSTAIIETENPDAKIVRITIGEKWTLIPTLPTLAYNSDNQFRFMMSVTDMNFLGLNWFLLGQLDFTTATAFFAIFNITFNNIIRGLSLSTEILYNDTLIINYDEMGYVTYENRQISTYFKLGTSIKPLKYIYLNFFNSISYLDNSVIIDTIGQDDPLNELAYNISLSPTLDLTYFRLETPFNIALKKVNLESPDMETYAPENQVDLDLSITPSLSYSNLEVIGDYWKGFFSSASWSYNPDKLFKNTTDTWSLAVTAGYTFPLLNIMEFRSVLSYTLYNDVNYVSYYWLKNRGYQTIHTVNFDLDYNIILFRIPDFLHIGKSLLILRTSLNAAYYGDFSMGMSLDLQWKLLKIYLAPHFYIKFNIFDLFTGHSFWENTNLAFIL